MDTTIEINHNGTCIRITKRDKKCFYNFFGQSNKEIVKVVQYLEQVNAPMETSTKLIMQEMFK